MKPGRFYTGIAVGAVAFSFIGWFTLAALAVPPVVAVWRAERRKRLWPG